MAVYATAGTPWLKPGASSYVATVTQKDANKANTKAAAYLSSQQQAQFAQWQKSALDQVNAQKAQLRAIATAQEAAETAKREAEAKKQADAIRVAQEAEQQKQMQQQAQSSAQQASGGSPGSVKMAAAAAQTGAGMTASPFKSAIDTARKSGNQFYSTGQSRFGGY